MQRGKHCKPNGRECRVRDLKRNLMVKQAAINELQKALSMLAGEVEDLRKKNKDLKLLLEFYKGVGE